MNKVLEFFKENDTKEIIQKKVKVYGWQNEYDYLLISSVSNYLFEDLELIENIVEINEDNRPGRVTKKEYVTVHDTGDASAFRTAEFWSNAVKKRSWEPTQGEISKYLCSYQYVVDNNHIYHNLPDNEVAYHAGDGTKFDYQLIDALVTGTNPHPLITISSDGYYEIDGKKSCILAPRIVNETEGVLVTNRLANNNDLNDQSILCKLIDGKYYLGVTYYSKGYKLIANRGGNNNSIGIESCICEGQDLYYTWQKTAKLVAYLLDSNDLTIDNVKQHHYFSGKNCPQTMRENQMWEHFLSLVVFEKEILNFKKEGYKIELISNSELIEKNGRVKSLDNNYITVTIRTIKDGIVEEYTKQMKGC